MTWSREPGGALTKLVLLTSGVPAAVGTTCLIPVLPKIEEALAHHSTDTYLVKLVSVAIGLGMIIGAPVAGHLSDRIGRKRILIAAYLVFALSGGAGFFLSDFASLITCRIIVGAAASAALTAGVALIADRYEGHACSRLMGLNAMTSGLSTLVGMPIAGALGGISWHFPFLMHIVGLPLAILATTLVEASTDRAGQPPKAARLSYFPFGLVLMAVIAGMIIYAPPIFMPFRLREIGIDSPAMIAGLVTLKSTAAALMASTYGWARRHLTIAQVFMVCFALCAIGNGGLAVLPSYATQIGGALVFGIGVGWVAPNLMNAATAIAANETRGRMVGIVKAGNLVASFLGVLVLEPLSKIGGPSLALTAVAALSGTMLIFCLIRHGRSDGPAAARSA